MSEDIHEVYAIRYGHHARRSPENFIGGDPHDVPQPLDFFVWAILGPSGVIIVDTGFDEAMGRRRQREIVKPVRDGLNALGVAPESVAAVIISHMHYDHCGNYDLFPRAAWGRADLLQGLADRPLDLPRPCRPAARPGQAVGPCQAGRRAEDRGSARFR